MDEKVVLVRARVLLMRASVDLMRASVDLMKARKSSLKSKNSSTLPIQRRLPLPHTSPDEVHFQEME